MSRTLFASVVLIVLAACSSARDQAAQVDSTAAAPSPVALVEGFATPESAIYDADLDVWFVTNINGVPSEKDNNGFISRMHPGGHVDSLHFIQGGRDGVTLNAPKGTAIVGDTLWVADIDAVRGFNKRTGAALSSVEIPGAVFLNDIAVGPDGSLYVTDTGIRIEATGMTHPGPDRVFRIGPDRAVTTALEGEQVATANGIAWDAAGNRFVIVFFGGPAIRSWTPGSPTLDSIAAGPGSHDGVVVLGDGRILVSSWADSTVFVAGGPKVVTGMESPADIGFDAGRGQIAIPLFNANRVALWTVGQ
jgi:sugar lactone lactonase YvrE